MQEHSTPDLSTRLTLFQNKLFIAKFMEILNNNANHVAIQNAEKYLSYQDLNDASDITATFLINLGLKIHDRMIIIADRNPNLIILAVAAFKVGITISIVDNTYPIDYINTCIEILQPQICINLNQEFPVESLQKFVSIKHYLNFFDIPVVNASTKFSTDTFEFNDTAIITFTSGTSGKPKAVLGRYGSLTQFYPWMDEKFGSFSPDRFGLCSNLGHDPLQRDIFTPLYFGATIVIPDKQDIFAPGMFPHWLKIQGITVCCITPAMCKFITTFKDEEFAIPSLRLLFFVGSNLTRNQISNIRKVAVKARIINLYGSTETQRAVSYFEIPNILDELPDIIPIGQGMCGVELVILKEHSFEACTVGDIGEIIVRSPCISKGYLNAPMENTEKFVKNPCTNDEYDIMYRTGDLGFYDLNSSLGVRCIGRIDQQVKINGHRVELEYITNVCLSWPEVNDCVTSVSEEGGHTQLICYIVIANLDVDKLVAYLKSKIPSYMIPNKFITLQSIPLTLNGKVDYKKLMEIYKNSHVNTLNMQDYQISSTLQLIINQLKNMLNIDSININLNSGRIYT